MLAYEPVNCDEINVELQQAVKEELITEKAADKIYRGCLRLNERV